MRYQMPYIEEPVIIDDTAHYFMATLADLDPFNFLFVPDTYDLWMWYQWVMFDGYLNVGTCARTFMQRVHHRSFSMYPVSLCKNKEYPEDSIVSEYSEIVDRNLTRLWMLGIPSFQTWR